MTNKLRRSENHSGQLLPTKPKRFKQLIESLDGSTKDNKESLRESLKSLRTKWLESLKVNREEFCLRIKEIRNEFKNDREDILDSNEGDE